MTGDRMPVGYRYDGTIYQNGYFSLPIDPASSLCLDGGHPVGTGLDTPYASVVRFMVNCFPQQAWQETRHRHWAVPWSVVTHAHAHACVPPSVRHVQDSFMRCIRVVPDTECSPTGSLSAARLLEAMYVSPTSSSLPSIQPSIVSAKYVTGEEAVLNHGHLPEPTVMQSSAVCNNAVVSVAYMAIMSPSGRLDELRAQVLLGNATKNSAGLFVLQQGFSMVFRTADSQVCSYSCKARINLCLCVLACMTRLRVAGASMAQQRQPWLQTGRYGASCKSRQCQDSAGSGRWHLSAFI
jgi:Protein of unknown function (DUF1619)